MDVNFFLQQRLQFIRHFYDTASAPMRETKRLIEAGEPPFDDLGYDQSGEPPYVDEWMQADVEIELVGRACVSMLSEALKQFLLISERETLAGDRPCRKAFGSAFEGGFLAGYLTCFKEACSIMVDECPAKLDVIEQVVLARNLSQHVDLVSDHVEHDGNTRAKYPRPFFMRPDEISSDREVVGRFLLPTLHINRDNLFEAIEQVNVLANWLQCRLEEWWRRPSAGK